MNVSRGDQGDIRGTRGGFPLFQARSIIMAAVQLSHGKDSVWEWFAPSMQCGCRVIGSREQDTEEQARRMLGDVFKREKRFSLGRLTPALGEELTEAAITLSIGGPEQDWGGIFEGNFGTDHELKASFFGGDVHSDGAREAVAIGDGDAGLTQIRGLGDEFAGLGGPLEERETGLAVKLNVTDRRRCSGFQIR